ncbi:hypothetical protein KW783_01220 [Candidatus Parcubacteria bacterium]|nr:hypothetical protein [Candidatus Parcubacteria bacterium]
MLAADVPWRRKFLFQKETVMQRVIGIRHRVKQTREGEARPTMVAILYPGNPMDPTVYELESENDELDFVLRQFPVAWREVTPEDDLSKTPVRHVKWKRVPKTEKEKIAELKATRPASHIRQEDGKTFVAEKMAHLFDGFTAGDTVAMILGGSGDLFAYALADRAEKIGSGEVIRIPPFVIKDERAGRPMDEDHILLAELGLHNRELFHLVRTRDKKLIWMRVCYHQRIDAMKARIGCEQRLIQRTIGTVFSVPETYAGASIEKAVIDAKASSAILKGLETEEAKAENVLAKAVKDLDVFDKVFEPVEGIGWALATRIISAVQDIRRFADKGKLRAFLGAHVISMAKCEKCGTAKHRREFWKDNVLVCPNCGAHDAVKPFGIFPRIRNSQVANWNPDGRQGLYLFGDQMNRRPGSYWGGRMIAHKKLLREKYPEPFKIVNDAGKEVTRMSDMHVHRTATWKTISDFVDWMFGAWWDLEKGEPIRPFPPLPPELAKFAPPAGDDHGKILADGGVTAAEEKPLAKPEEKTSELDPTENFAAGVERVAEIVAKDAELVGAE